MKKRLLLLWVLLVLAALAGVGCAGGGGDDDDAAHDDAGGDDDADDDGSGDDDADDDDTDDDDTDDDDTGDDDADDDTAIPGDFEATLVTNPICNISCVVTWTTDEPASSWVQFGEAGKGFTHQIGSDDLTTAHEVVVVGMHADTKYDLLAVSRTAGDVETHSQTLSFTADSLPYYWLAAEVDVYDETKARDGWTIANIASATMESGLVVAIYDMNGYPVWYYAPYGSNARADLEVHLVDGNHVSIGPAVAQGDHPFVMDLQGNVLWEGPEQTGQGMSDDGAMHHVFHQVGTNGDYVTVFIDERDDTAGDNIVRLDSELNTVWSWNAWDHLTPDAGPAGDWTHFNTVVIEDDNGVAYVNSFMLNTLFKIDLDTGEILWQFGEGGDFAADPDADYPWFVGGHGVDNLGDGYFLVYDNGDITRAYSRAVVYHLDESTMESTITWEYAGDDSDDKWFNLSLGDADQLDNGNILITAGNSTQNQSASRFIEVTADGEKVWQLWLYWSNTKRISSYQADRIDALAVPIEE